MPLSVPSSFDKFIENISLAGDHNEIAETRRKTIVSLLQNSFEILDSFAIGSIPKGTALKAHADLDIMVVLHWSRHIKDKSPAQVLQAVRDALGEYRTNVRKNGQAVTWYAGSWPDVDVVPVGRFDNKDGSVAHYSVPDMDSGRWLVARPRRHANAITAKAAECGAGFRPLVRMIKHWNCAHSELMESYHIEVLALHALSGPIQDYGWAVYSFFDNTLGLVKTALPYEGGYADDYLDGETRREILKRLETARDKASEAWYLTYNGRLEHRRAIDLWRQLFGDKFPSYG